jgi:AraC family transcriptional regulator, arabinose operon regulatory protein
MSRSALDLAAVKAPAMAVAKEPDHGLGPPDGNVLAAGTALWEPTTGPWRPAMWGGRLLTFTAAGRGVYACEGVELVVRRGDVVVLDKDSPATHAVPPGEPWDYAYLLFTKPQRWRLPPGFDQVATGLYRAHVGHEPTRQHVLDACARIAATFGRRDTARALNDLDDRPPDHLTGPAEDLQRRLLLTMVEEILLLVVQAPCDSAALDPRVTFTLETMGTNPVGPHSIASLAEAVNVSPSRFIHLFTTQIGTSPMRTLRLIRLQHAARLLQSTAHPVAAVAQASGFGSPFVFSREFRRHHGITPSAYRTHWRGQ